MRNSIASICILACLTACQQQPTDQRKTEAPARVAAPAPPPSVFSEVKDACVTVQNMGSPMLVARSYTLSQLIERLFKAAGEVDMHWERTDGAVFMRFEKTDPLTQKTTSVAMEFKEDGSEFGREVAAANVPCGPQVYRLTRSVVDGQLESEYGLSSAMANTVEALEKEGATPAAHRQQRAQSSPSSQPSAVTGSSRGVVAHVLEFARQQMDEARSSFTSSSSSSSCSGFYGPLMGKSPHDPDGSFTIQVEETTIDVRFSDYGSMSGSKVVKPDGTIEFTDRGDAPSTLRCAGNSAVVTFGASQDSPSRTIHLQRVNGDIFHVAAERGWDISENDSE